VPDKRYELVLAFESPPPRCSRSRLNGYGLEYIDCYLVHGPNPLELYIAGREKGLAECVDSGNDQDGRSSQLLGRGHVRKCRRSSPNTESPLRHETNASTRSCADFPETSGLLKACRDNNIVFQELLVSRPRAARRQIQPRTTPPPKTYRFSSYPMEEIEPTLKVVESIVSMAAVALNYNMCNGVVPVVGVRRPQQVEQNIQAFGWRLSNAEIGRLDAISVEGKATKLWAAGIMVDDVPAMILLSQQTVSMVGLLFPSSEDVLDGSQECAEHLYRSQCQRDTVPNLDMEHQSQNHSPP
jgi:aryl-alcohol dehydrogenase-like predicted oxidoreductase